MRYGHHPGIVSLKTVYEEAGKIYLVLQLLRGGDLLDYMIKKVLFPINFLSRLISFDYFD